MSVAIVVPVHRNAATLTALVQRLEQALNEPWTLRLVIDACPDGSADVAAELAASDPRVRVTHLTSNVGQHQALLRGLIDEPWATAWVIMDADLQDPPEAVPTLLGELRDRGVSGVFAGRRGAYESFGRRLTGRVHRRLMVALSNLPPDAGAFFAMSSELRDVVVQALRQQGAPSVVAAAGSSAFRLTSVPVFRAVRTQGSSSWTSLARLRHAARTMVWSARHRPVPMDACGNLRPKW